MPKNLPSSTTDVPSSKNVRETNMLRPMAGKEQTTSKPTFKKQLKTHPKFGKLGGKGHG